MLTVENAHFRIQADGTTRHVYEPPYVEPLLRALWTESADGGAQVEVGPIDPANPYIGHLKIREIESIDAELGRIRSRYEKHPRTHGPLFDLIYPGGTFESAVQREIKRGVSAPEKKAVTNVVTDLSELIALPIVGTALAAAIHAKYDVTTPEELLGKVSVADLQTIPRIGAHKAQEIYEACMVAVHGQKDDAETDELTAVDE